MDADDGLVNPRDMLSDVGDEIVELLGSGVAHRVGDVDDLCPIFQNGGKNLAEKVPVAPGRILRGKLDHIYVAAGQPDRIDGHAQDFIGPFVQLVFHMNVRCGDKGMNARLVGRAQSFPSPLHIFSDGPGQGTDVRALDLFGNSLHCGEVPWGGHGKTSLDDVNPQTGQLFGDLHFFLGIKANARGLLAIP